MGRDWYLKHALRSNSHHAFILKEYKSKQPPVLDARATAVRLIDLKWGNFGYKWQLQVSETARWVPRHFNVGKTTFGEIEAIVIMLKTNKQTNGVKSPLTAFFFQLVQLWTELQQIFS